MHSDFWNAFSASYRENLGRWKRFDSPALPPSGSGWKRTWTANPALLPWGGKTLMYYRGTGAASGDPEERDQIGVALVELESSGIAVEDLGIAVPSGGRATWDADVLDPAPVAFQNQVFLYYSALGSAGDTIGLAKSSDGVSFGRGEPVMPGRAPAVVDWQEHLWLLSQEMQDGGYVLKLFKSNDGTNFEVARKEPVFTGTPGDWDSLSVVTARIYKEDDGFYMIYGGSADTVDEPAYFGLARSSNLVDWEKHPGNPIFGAGSRGAPDGGCIWFPALVRLPEGWLLLYEGSVGTPRWGLDCAICGAFLDASG